MGLRASSNILVRDEFLASAKIQIPYHPICSPLNVLTSESCLPVFFTVCIKYFGVFIYAKSQGFRTCFCFCFQAQMLYIGPYSVGVVGTATHRVQYIRLALLTGPVE